MAHEPGAAMGADSVRGAGGGVSGRGGGRLVVVGTGIRSIAQLTQEAMAWIRAADIVCYALADPVTERWVIDNARASEDLALFYDEATTRLTTYAAMAARMAGHAQSGLTVVGVFYGHPGVFTDPSHRAVAIARGAGIPAQMLPGVSALDCLCADLGIDIGEGSSQTFDATEMMMRARRPDPGAHVIIWQIGVLAQPGFDRRRGASDLTPLVDYLLQFYPPEHPVTHYQGAQLVLCDPVVEVLALKDLAGIAAAVTSTLYVPPVSVPEFDMEMAATLGLDDPDKFDGAQENPAPYWDGAIPALPERDWHQPVAAPGPMSGLLESLSMDPALVDDFNVDPALFLRTVGLDPVESWAVLTRNGAWMSACVRYGSGVAAAVAWGLATTEEEARGFVVASDGRLMRRRARRDPGPEPEPTG